MKITLLSMMIMMLASFRITHLIVFDKIASFLRKPFFSVIEKENGELDIEIKGTGIRHFIGSLLSCYWCTGFWVSVGVVLVYYFVPLLYPVLIVFAVAGAGAFIESKV